MFVIDYTVLRGAAQVNQEAYVSQQYGSGSGSRSGEYYDGVSDSTFDGAGGGEPFVEGGEYADPQQQHQQQQQGNYGHQRYTDEADDQWY